MAKYIALAEVDKTKQDKAIAEHKAQKGVDTDTDGKAKKRKKKDASAPKNPKNAFLFFAKEQRPIVKAANRNASFGELVRLP
jgi:hypothetical protein